MSKKQINLSMINYDICCRLIRKLPKKEWVHISKIPSDIWEYFFNFFIEVKIFRILYQHKKRKNIIKKIVHSIDMDSDREDQYFRINWHSHLYVDDYKKSYNNCISN